MFNKKDFFYIQGIIMLYAIKVHEGKIAAAKELNISIDTLNKYVDMLETSFGTKLVTVVDRKCLLTPTGHKIISHVPNIKNCLQDVFSSIITEPNTKATVRVAYDRNIRSIFYAEGLADFFKTYPNLSLYIDVYDEIPRLSHSEYDICLTYSLPKDSDWSLVYSKELKCGFFASPEYLQMNRYPTDIDDILRNHRIVLFNQTFSHSETKNLIDKSQGGFCLSNSLFATNDILTKGGGVGIMPLINAKTGKVVCLDNIPCDIKHTVYLLSPKHVKDKTHVRIVLNYYKNLLEKL